MKLDISTANDDAKGDDVDPLALLFNEEPGAVLEVAPQNRPRVEECLKRFGVTYAFIGETTVDQRIRVSRHMYSELCSRTRQSS